MRFFLLLLKYIVVTCLLLNSAKTFAQTSKTIKTLSIGDKMPDVKITNIINSHIKSGKISDYKGKLILLDFWSTWCSACIDGFSELDSLQRQYPDKIQILLVNPKREGDSKKGVQIVINRMNEWSTRPFRLPIVFQDTSITKNFQFHSLPHCVWIGPDGKVIGITGKEEVTIQNIKKGIAGKKIEIIANKH
ncbi:Thioredoxin-like [Mucilaginibacter pineti]|uniref:Thioredoxin-like n=1 Tax=Mucilaginibacter pineti TaxID=1391627 RepID=A0A1G7CLE4_9SPHI|nr:TlpA disulfide reductase family protein [Mucilaginibacter pineti]SDE40147.1 Thioredoxin-like [Mucilaginibacter pineti]